MNLIDAKFCKDAQETLWLLLAGFTADEIRKGSCAVTTALAEYRADTGHKCSEETCGAAVHRKGATGPWPSRCSVHARIHAEGKKEQANKARRGDRPLTAVCKICKHEFAVSKYGPVPEYCLDHAAAGYGRKYREKKREESGKPDPYRANDWIRETTRRRGSGLAKRRRKSVDSAREEVHSG